MITYAELNTAFGFEVDDVFGDTFRPSVRVGAFNAAIRRATSALGYAMANKKGPEEALRELTMLRVFQTNSQGGVNLNDPSLGHSIWNVLGVYARPELTSDATINPTQDSESQYRSDVSFAGSGHEVERVTLEEVPMIRTNFLRNGNEVLSSNLGRVTFAYYIIGDASSSSYLSGSSELRVLPQSVTKKSFIAISYVKTPEPIVDENSVIEFPKSFLQALVAWSVAYATVRQGAGPSMNMSAEQDAATLFQFIA